MRTLSIDDLTNIAYGACFMASGGGAPLKTALNLISVLQQDPLAGEIRVVPVDEAQADGLTATIACIGAPDAMLTLESSEEFLHAFDQLNQLNQAATGKPITSVIPVEIGGFNTIAPMLVAARREGVAVVDGNGAGRAVPSLSQLTFSASIYNISTIPTILASAQGPAVDIRAEGARDTGLVARDILGAGSSLFDEQAGLAMWVMDKAQLQQAVVSRGSLALTQSIGKALRTSSNPVDDALSLVEAAGRKTYRLYHGVVHSPDEKTEGGFDFGQTVFSNQADATRAVVYNQNENLLAWGSWRDQPLAIAPDSICYVTDGGLPFSNADIDQTFDGQKVAGQPSLLFGIETIPELLSLPSVRESFEQAVVGIGYAGKYVPIGELAPLE